MVSKCAETLYNRLKDFAPWFFFARFPSLTDRIVCLKEKWRNQWSLFYVNNKNGFFIATKLSRVTQNVLKRGPGNMSKAYAGCDNQLGWRLRSRLLEGGNYSGNIFRHQKNWTIKHPHWTNDSAGSEIWLSIVWNTGMNSIYLFYTIYRRMAFGLDYISPSKKPA